MAVNTVKCQNVSIICTGYRVSPCVLSRLQAYIGFTVCQCTNIVCQLHVSYHVPAQQQLGLAVSATCAT